VLAVLEEPAGHVTAMSEPDAAPLILAAMAVAGSAPLLRTMLPALAVRPVLDAGAAEVNKPAAPAHLYCPTAHAPNKSTRLILEDILALTEYPGSKSTQAAFWVVALTPVAAAPVSALPVPVGHDAAAPLAAVVCRATSPVNLMFPDVEPVARAISPAFPRQ